MRMILIRSSFTANSASWQGKSPFKEFWQLKSENDHQGEEALLLKLLKLLTVSIQLRAVKTSKTNFLFDWNGFLC